MQYFRNKTAVITGASSGLGKALAEALAKHGCNLALADINVEGLEHLQAHLQAIGIRCSIHAVDVSDYQAMQTFADTVLQTHQEIHILFNNAGVTLLDSIENSSIDDAQWLMGVNYWGVVYGTKVFLPHLRNVEAAHIVNISSLFGLISVPHQSAYNASKFAVRGFTEALSMELADTNIAVSCVHPGGIKTNIVRTARFGKAFDKKHYINNFDKIAMTSPERAAHVILKKMQHRRRRILVGIDAIGIDFIARCLPACYEYVFRLVKRSKN